ncbi:MAG: hypothetical protein WCA29_02910 [Jiangellales bacterium]
MVGGLRDYGPEPSRVPLAPLTLVFGPNSAGKSSLLSTLTLLAQSIAPSRTRVLVMLWVDRFGPPVEVSTTVVVFDKYAGVQAARRYIHGEGNADGLSWFVSRVALSLGPGRQAFAWPKVKETIVVAQRPVADAKAREAVAERAQVRPPSQGWVRHPARSARMDA